VSSLLVLSAWYVYADASQTSGLSTCRLKAKRTEITIPPSLPMDRGMTLLPPPKKEVMFLVRSVCLSVCLIVCLSVGLLTNLWTDFDEIFWRGRAWIKDQVIQFWWRSGSRFGSGSPKSEIWILWIGGGLCSLSISFLFVTVMCHCLAVLCRMAMWRRYLRTAKREHSSWTWMQPT